MNILLMVIVGIVLFFVFNFFVGIVGFNTIVILLLSLILAGIILGH